MAENKGQQGSGRHPHKSTDEPWSHTKDEGAQHGKSHSSGRDGDNRSHGRSQETQSRGQDHDRAEAEDLKRREYRGADGEIHHHTRTYMEQHGDSHDDRGGDQLHSGGGHGRSHSGERKDDRSHGDDNNRSHGREHAHSGSNNRSDRRR